MTRRARRLHWTESAAFHVVFNRGHNRDILFTDDEDRRAFLDLLGRYRQRFRFGLYRYCLMTNHFHLLVRLPDPRRLSAFMAGFLGAGGDAFHFVHRARGFR